MSSEELTTKISQLALDLVKITNNLNSNQSLVNSLEDENLKTLYTNNINELISKYLDIKKDLEIALSEYRKYEYDNNLPSNISYVRLQKEIKKLII